MTWTWIKGLIAHRRSRILGVIAGVMVAVALLASIGAFLSSTTSKMTERAVSTVATDWQVEVSNGADPANVLKQVKAFDSVSVATPAQIASTPGFAARSKASSQQTGAGKVIGLPRGFSATFPGQIRTLAGKSHGILIAQQTAANLDAKPGQTVSVSRPGMPPAMVRVDGVVEMSAADSFFQKVGAPVGSQPQAPPDNVMLMPTKRFTSIMGSGRGAVTTQIFANINHSLPGSPSSAYTQVSGQARNLETKLAGNGLVGDNIGTALDAARADALYAQILFLFLGLPGAIIAGLVTAAIASSGGNRRRRDAALLRTRGASTSDLVRLAFSESAIAAGVGVALGLIVALVVGKSVFGTASFGASTISALLWACGAALMGITITTLTIAVPAWKDARGLTVAGQQRQVGRTRQSPFWMRYGVDFLLLIAAGLVFWQASKGGYKLVLAPEGVAQVSVNWYALISPVFAWIGAGLLSYRIADLVLRRGQRSLAAGIKPIAGQLSPTVASTMGRQRRLLAGSIALVALTLAFAASTAVFNSTYQQQAEVDARLSNGADVTVTESPGRVVGPGEASRLSQVSGVKAVEPLQHRFAYVGSDLQDLYGVKPSSIESAGQLQNAWFQGGSAGNLMSQLAAKPDSVLVSAETVTDFQLKPNDLIRLRLQDGVTKKFMTVPFHYIGIANEFPTAPRDSFFVANASYVAQKTGSDAVGSFLIQTDGTSPATVAAAVKQKVGTSAQVTDIVTERKVVGSNLTAVELSGLTKVELGFALALAIAASGLTLGLGLQERRRTYAIASALGATNRQLGAFVWSESGFVLGGGLVLGAAMASGMVYLLVKILTSVFDPPPDALAIPWLYLTCAALIVVAATGSASALMLRSLRRPAIEELRDL